jgi:inorganic pyrophosphatase/exopolyphosphatase
MDEQKKLKFLQIKSLMGDNPHQETKMDVLAAARLSTIAETGNKQEVGLAMLKKQQDIAKSTATQLLDSVAPAQPVQNLPAHLGNKVNTSA